ncbi:hypothetical protein [Actimicrobium antarcticum]|uniref:Uncharacterized protein n=1 Tax=Actimicrobium antarcticum TaxID=1051899 RepID=A0ABP7SUA7_9BURK
MSVDDAIDLFALTSPRREPVDVAEPKRQDKSLLKLIGVHKRRLEWMEWQCRQALVDWRERRHVVTQIKQEWRDAKQHATDFWAGARAEFFRMEISSGKFRTAKGAYERKKLDAEKVHVRAREAANEARQAGRTYFVAKQELRAGHLRSEKLDILQKIIHEKNNPVE